MLTKELVAASTVPLVLSVLTEGESYGYALIQRVRRSTTHQGAQDGGIQEVVMATNPTVEGDGTALYISNLMSELPVTITRLARGITTGSVLEFANKEMLTDALSGRQRF